MSDSFQAMSVIYYIQGSREGEFINLKLIKEMYIELIMSRR